MEHRAALVEECTRCKGLGDFHDHVSTCRDTGVSTYKIRKCTDCSNGWVVKKAYKEKNIGAMLLKVQKDIQNELK